MLRSGRRTGPDHRLQVAIAGIGLVVLTAVASGTITLDALVTVPTAMFVAVYAICTAAAVRLTTGGTRVVAAIACAVVVVILGFSGWALVAVIVVGVLAGGWPARGAEGYRIAAAVEPLSKQIRTSDDVPTTNAGSGPCPSARSSAWVSRRSRTSPTA